MKLRDALIATALFIHGTIIAQVSPADAIATFQLEKGLRIELVAAEPLVTSPCAIAFDPKGRMFVAENRGYPRSAKPPIGFAENNTALRRSWNVSNSTANESFWRS